MTFRLAVAFIVSFSFSALAQPDPVLTTMVQHITAANEGVAPNADCEPLRLACSVTDGQFNSVDRLSINPQYFSLLTRSVASDPTLIAFIAKKVRVPGINQINVRKLQISAPRLTELNCEASSAAFTGRCQGPAEEVFLQLQAEYSGSERGFYQLNAGGGKITNMIVTSEALNEPPYDLLVKAEIEMIFDGEPLRIKSSQKFKTQRCSR